MLRFRKRLSQQALLLLTVFSLTWQFSCERRKNALRVINEIEEKEGECCDFIEVRDTFQIIVIDFYPSCICGGPTACASSTIGKRLGLNDSVRVLSVCFNDSILNAGDTVIIAPTNEPNFHVSHGPWMKYDRERKRYIESYIQLERFKTTYGYILVD